MKFFSMCFPMAEDQDVEGNRYNDALLSFCPIKMYISGVNDTILKFYLHRSVQKVKMHDSLQPEFLFLTMYMSYI